MNEGAAALSVLLSISVSSALLCHWHIRNYVRASGVAALVATVAFQVAEFIHLGHLDALFIVALFTGAALGLAVAFIVGAPFLIVRRKTKSRPAR